MTVVGAISLAILLLAALPAAATPIGLLDESEQAAAEALALYDEVTTRHALEAVTGNQPAGKRFMVVARRLQPIDNTAQAMLNPKL